MLYGNYLYMIFTVLDWAYICLMNNDNILISENMFSN